MGYPEFKPNGKEYWSIEEAELLLTGDIYWSEKVDGKSEYEKVLFNDIVYIVFYENIKEVHSLEYKWSSTKKIAFDVYSQQRKQFVQPTQFMEFYHFIPYVHEKNVNRDEVYEFLKDVVRLHTKDSSCLIGPKREGLVIKNYNRGMFGKIINPEFEDGIKENYIRKNRRS